MCNLILLSDLSYGAFYYIYDALGNPQATFWLDKR